MLKRLWYLSIRNVKKGSIAYFSEPRTSKQGLVHSHNFSTLKGKKKKKQVNNQILKSSFYSGS